MPNETFTPRAVAKASKPSAGSANIYSVPVFGVVKDNVDPTRSGRVRVYISNMNGPEPDNSINWVTVGYMSTFFGMTSADGGNDTTGSYVDNPSSYGDWHSPPDIGTTVICIFINGDPNYGYYVGCVPDPAALYMVPAIGSSDNVIPNSGEANSYAGALRLPVGNINTNNDSIANSPDYATAPKPVHSYVASIMSQQGIIRDPIRGPISSSAQRETVSRVGWGISTPGRPIYKGGYTDQTIPAGLSNPDGLQVVARRGGHSIVMDDGDLIGKDQLIRIRTALGHQIMMSDDGQTLMILHSNGQSYIELGKEGTVDIYSTNSFNVRTQGDINLHADNNFNIHTNNTLNIKAKTFNLDVDQGINIKSGADITTSATNNITAKAGGSIAYGAIGNASLKANGNAYMVGAKIYLNSGDAPLQPADVPNITLNAQTDTLFDKDKGFLAAPGKLLSVTSRAPAHAPWANAGQGVDVKVNIDADSQLPSSPSDSVSSATSTGISANTISTAAATVASVPNSTSISSALDTGTTNAVLGAAATCSATGAASDAVLQGAGVVQTANGAVASIGAYAQTPSQLMNSGILKPGTPTMINSLVGSGSNIASAMPSNVFSGQPGASTLTQFVSNPAAQTASMVNNMQQNNTALQVAGVLAGNESSTQVAGLVASATTTGIGSTIGAITGTVSNIASGLVGSAGGIIGGALGAIGMGASAAGLASSVIGGLGGISNSLSGIQRGYSLSGLSALSLGISGAAFSAIKGSLPSMTAGIPQNLTALAKSAASNNNLIAGQTSQLSSSLISTVSGTAGAALNSVSSITGAVTTATSSLPTSVISAATTSSLNAVSGVGSTYAISGTSGLSAAANALHSGSVASTVNTLAGGVNNLPGGANVINSVVNNATGAGNSIPGVGTLSSTIQGAQSAALSGLPLPAIPGGVNSLTSLVTSGLPVGAASQMLSSVSSLTSGTNGAIKLPTVATGTINRSAITSQISSTLGNPKIPVPSFLNQKG